MKKAVKIIGFILMLLSVAYVIHTLKKSFNFEASLPDAGSAAVIFGAGIIISALSVFLLAYIWARIVAFISGRRDKAVIRQGISVYVKANLGKYLPGNVFQYVERNVFLADSDMKQADIALCSVLEIGGLLTAVFLLCIILSADKLAFFFNNYGTAFLIILALAAVAVIILIVFSRKSNYLASLFKRIFTIDFIRLALVSILMYMAVLLIIASVMLLAACIISPDSVSVRFVIDTVAVYIVSWLAGFIVIGAPGGIGIRETVVSLFTAESSLAGTLLLAVVFQRFISIAGDIAAYLIVMLSHKKGQSD